MLQIAKILKSNGTDGGLLIGVRDIEVGQIDLQEPVFIEFDGLPVPFFIQDLQQRGNSKAIIHLNDITSLADAEEVVGRAVYVEGEWEEEEELDFTGWTLLCRGERVGVVSGLEPIPGNPLLIIEAPPQTPAASSPFPTLHPQSPGSGRSADADLASLKAKPGNDILIPLHPDLILSADPATRTLDLDLPDGLL